jgi:transmembrane sensor
VENVDDILNLITGNLSDSQRKKAFSELKNKPENKELYRRAKTTWALMSSTREMPDYRIEKSYQKLFTRIFKQNNLRLSPFVRYAAAILLLTGLSTVMYLWGSHNLHHSLSKSYTMIVAEKGQVSKVILPDSSVVWLNSGTTLKYDNKFSQTNRDLYLNGEAYLNVKKNKDLPLIVKSGDLQVKVLGTKFDVKAYPDDNKINVTLESGKIELLSPENKLFKYELKPGQMASIDSSLSKIEIGPVNLQDRSTWKEGQLIFIDTPMTEVIKILKRRFDVDFEISDSKVERSVFNANFKSESLKEILDYIQFSCHINYRILNENTKIKVFLN